MPFFLESLAAYYQIQWSDLEAQGFPKDSLTPYYTVILYHCLDSRGDAVDVKNYVVSTQTVILTNNPKGDKPVTLWLRCQSASTRGPG